MREHYGQHQNCQGCRAYRLEEERQTQRVREAVRAANEQALREHERRARAAAIPTEPIDLGYLEATVIGRDQS
jgi:phage baseplate assembly protein W